MSVSQKQTVEIIKVLYRGADILILDEPTAVLTPQETEKLFRSSAEICETTARRSLSLPIKCMKLRACLTAWPCCDAAALSAIWRQRRRMSQEMTDMMVGHKVTLNIDTPGAGESEAAY